MLSNQGFCAECGKHYEDMTQEEQEHMNEHYSTCSKECFFK